MDAILGRMSPGGRPKAKDPRIHETRFRYTAGEHEAVLEAAGEDGVDPSAWGRSFAVAAARVDAETRKRWLAAADREERAAKRAHRSTPDA